MTTQELIKAFDGVTGPMVVRTCLYILLEAEIITHRYQPTNKINPPQYSVWSVRFEKEKKGK